MTTKNNSNGEKMKQLLISISLIVGLSLSASIQADIIRDVDDQFDAGNYHKAFQMLNSACQSRNFKGCMVLGSMFYLGKGGVNTDHPKALTLFNKACKGGNVEGCSMSAGMYYDGKGTIKNNTKALSLHKKSCYGGLIDSCSTAGTLLSEIGTPQSLQQALPFYKKGCQGKIAGSCFSIGVMYILGQGTRKNIPYGKGFLKQSCVLGRQDACDFHSKMTGAGL